ncbi:MAG: class I SAM-dependent methyltransferase [Candidatus Aenigmatarchaeota archaeon]
MIYDKETLEQMYKEGRIPWDLGKPYKQLVEFVKENKPCHVLDVGCGTGTDAIFLAQNGFKVTAIDISEEAIRIAKSKAEKAGVKIDFRIGDALDMPFEDETFELVNDNGFFHLLDKPNRALFVKEVSRIMKPKSKYLMKCFSDKEPSNAGIPYKLPYRLSQETIRKYFSKKFKILYIKPIIIEGSQGRDHKGYFCLMERK